MNKSDLKLIVIVLLSAIMLLVIKKITYKDSYYAYIYYENKVIQKIDLRINDTYSVTGYNGEVVVEVKDKKIRVKEETSNLHICSRQGWISDSTPIICMPNKIIIKIESKDEKLDSVVR